MLPGYYYYYYYSVHVQWTGNLVTNAVATDLKAFYRVPTNFPLNGLMITLRTTLIRPVKPGQVNLQDSLSLPAHWQLLPTYLLHEMR